MPPITVRSHCFFWSCPRVSGHDRHCSGHFTPLAGVRRADRGTCNLHSGGTGILYPEDACTPWYLHPAPGDYSRGTGIPVWVVYTYRHTRRTPVPRTPVPRGTGMPPHHHTLFGLQVSAALTDSEPAVRAAAAEAAAALLSPAGSAGGGGGVHLPRGDVHLPRGDASDLARMLVRAGRTLKICTRTSSAGDVSALVSVCKLSAAQRSC